MKCINIIYVLFIRLPSFHKSYYEDINERGNFPQLDVPTNHSYIPVYLIIY